MSSQANFFKLGLFVIIAFILGVIFLTAFGAGRFLKKEILAETCFNESVQGLNIGSEVKYKGIKIGSVKSITSAAGVYETKSDYVLVVMSLESDISLGQTGKKARERVVRALEDGLSVQLAFKGLTGVAYLETDYRGEEADHALDITWKPKNLYIPSRKSSMKQFGESINQILDNLAALNLKGMTQDMETLLKNLDKKLNDIDVEKISGLTASLLVELKHTNQQIIETIASAKIREIIDDAGNAFSDLKMIIRESREPIARAVNDFKTAAESSKNIASGFEQKIEPNLENLSQNLEQLMDNMVSASHLLENMVWLNSDKVQTVIENLEVISENLKQLSRDIKKYPGRLLFEKPPGKIDLGKEK